MSAERVTLDDLGIAADWLDAYEAEDTGAPRHPDETYTGTDETAARLYKVAEWVRAEIARREREAYVRDLTRQVAAAYGRKASDPAVRRAVKRHLAERDAQQG